MASDRQRQTAVAHAQFLIDWKASIGYGDERPVPWIGQSKAGLLKRFKAGETWRPDCSGSVEWICKWAGLRSPTGLAWGLGGSQNMWAHLPHYTDPGHAHPGALVTYGNEGDAHVCMVMARDGENPWLFSHGSAAGPLHIRLRDESAAHAGQTVTFLDISHL